MNKQKYTNKTTGTISGKPLSKTFGKQQIRFDLEIIGDLITPESKVLDIGCGNGELLQYLKQVKKIDGRGLEISQKDTSEALKKGISVIQGNAEHDLAYYPNNSFDYAILSQTIQAMHNPKEIMEQTLRIAKYAIISLPNFAYFKNRLYLLCKGQMPVNEVIPYQWYDTPNIHFCTIKDFEKLCEKINFNIKKAIYLTGNDKLNKGKFTKLIERKFLANFFAQYGIFLITRNNAAVITQSETIFSKNNSLFSFNKVSAGLAANFDNNTKSYL